MHLNSFSWKIIDTYKCACSDYATHKKIYLVRHDDELSSSLSCVIADTLYFWEESDRQRSYRKVDV